MPGSHILTECVRRQTTDCTRVAIATTSITNISGSFMAALANLYNFSELAIESIAIFQTYFISNLVVLSLIFAPTPQHGQNEMFGLSPHLR